MLYHIVETRSLLVLGACTNIYLICNHQSDYLAILSIFQNKHIITISIRAEKWPDKRPQNRPESIENLPPRSLASDAGIIECDKCHNRDMVIAGRLMSGAGDDALTAKILGLKSVPSAEEVDRLCGMAVPPLKRKKQWAAAAAAASRKVAVSKR